MSDNEEMDFYERADGLLLPYLEDRLGVEDRLYVERMISEHEDLRKRLDTLKSTMTVLKNHRDALCPTPAELFDYATMGDETNPLLTKHLEHCAECRQQVEEYRAEDKRVIVPVRVRQAFTERCDGQTEGTIPDRFTAWSRLGESISNFISKFQIPVFATATVAAAILLVVVLYPGRDSGPQFALSNEDWSQGPQLNLMRPHRKEPRIATVILLSGFRKPLPQNRIDGLYESLKPDSSLKKRFKMLTPADISRFIRESGIGPQERNKFPAAVKKELQADKVLFLKIHREGARLTVHGELVNTHTGKTLRTVEEKPVPEPQLKSTLRTCFENILTDDSVTR